VPTLDEAPRQVLLRRPGFPDLRTIPATWQREARGNHIVTFAGCRVEISRETGKALRQHRDRYELSPEDLARCNAMADAAEAAEAARAAASAPATPPGHSAR
jgi:hypothetical protein